MRLLMVSASMDCGGAETHIHALAEGLRRRGHEVTIASGGGRLAEEWVRAGGIHVRIPLRRTPVAFGISFVRLWKLLRDTSFDLIHVHGRLSGFLCHVLSVCRGIPMVGTVHAHFRLGFLKHFCHWGSRSIAVSEDLKQYLCEGYGVPPRWVRVIPNGVDTERFCPCPKEKKKGHRIVFLSRLDRDCSLGAWLLCDLARELCAQDPALEILIAGDGTCRNDLERRGAEVNQAIGRTAIHFCGYVSNPEEILRQADVVLGVSRVALEAMSCGVPVILGGDEGWGGCLFPRELVRGAQTNFCCRGEASMTREALKRAIEEVFAQSEAQRARWGTELREYVLRHHSVERMARETEEVYRSALVRPSPRKRTILLCGYYGYGNVGDDALLYQSIQIAKERWGEGQAVALTRRGKKDSPVVGIPCVHRLCLSGILRQLRRTETLVLGGGTLLQENTSRRSLWYYTALIRLAADRGASVELWANGLGAPKSAWGANRMRVALARCKRLGFRDAFSCQIAHKLTEGIPHQKIRLEKDLAMETPSCGSERKAFLLGYYHLKRDRSYAVAVVHGGTERGYLKAFIYWMETLLEQGISLLLVPMYPAEDEALCQRLGRRWHCGVTRGLSAEDLVGLMEECCVVCGMRLHALVLAHCARAPFVGFGGDPKVRSFCREWGGVYFTDLYGKGKEGEVFYFG